jgi:hypothetical protein
MDKFNEPPERDDYAQTDDIPNSLSSIAFFLFCETDLEECPVVLFGAVKTENGIKTNCPVCGMFARTKGR